MHKLIEYICDELEELERKADKDGKLSMAEIEYGDTLAHFKKNLLKAEEMSGDGYSMAMGESYEGRYPRRYMIGGSYAPRRDRMGRYSRDGYSMDYGMMEELHELMEKAPDEQTKREFKRFIQKIENM